MAGAEKSPLLAGDRESGGNSTSLAASPGWTRKQKLVALALSLQNISLSISFGIMAPFYPGEAAKKGASPAQVGFIFGVFQLVIFITAPIYGKIVHKLGAKYMFLSGSFLLGGCSIAFGFLDGCPDGVVYVVMCFISRSIEANGCAMLSTASFAIMAKTFPDDVGKALGILETFSAAGMVLGPAVGAALYSVGGYRLPFIVIGCLVWTITLICFFLLPRIEDVSRIEDCFLQLLRIPGCMVVYLVIAACAVALSFLDPTFSPFMQKKFEFLSVVHIGLVMMIVPGTYALAAPVAGFFSDKGWLALSTISGLVATGVSFLFLGPSPILVSAVPNTLLEVCITLVFLGVGIGFGLIPLFPLVFKLARNAGLEDGIQTLGIISGFFNSGFSFGGFLGTTVAGWLNGKYGFEIASYIYGNIMLMTLFNRSAGAGMISLIPAFVLHALVLITYVVVSWVRKEWPIEVTKLK